MESQTVDATHLTAPAGMAAHDFSALGLFMQADIVVNAPRRQ